MSVPALDLDMAPLREALSESDGAVSFAMSLPRDVAERFLEMLEAEQKGGVLVVPAKSEFTTTQAATILGVSRPHLVKLLDEGKIRFRMVGSHRRVLARSLTSFVEQDKDDRRKIVDEMGRLSDEWGLPE